MRITMRMAAALGAFLSAGFLYAGAQCRLVGTVTDTAGAPIEGAAIVITTPKLGTFKLTLKTDGKGKYSTIMNDCTMPYHVSIEKEGFVTYGEDKKIPINDMGTVDAKLASASAAKAPAPGAAHAAAAAPSGSEQAVVAFNAGVEAVNAGDKAGAEAKFLEAVEKNPDLPNGWAALSTLAYEKKDWAKAVEYGEKAVDLDPTLTNLYPMLAEAAKNSGDKKAAAEWSAKYAEANPGIARDPLQQGNRGLQQGQDEGSRGGADQGRGGEARFRERAVLPGNVGVQPEPQGAREGAPREVSRARAQRQGSRRPPRRSSRRLSSRGGARRPAPRTRPTSSGSRPPSALALEAANQAERPVQQGVPRRRRSFSATARTATRPILDELEVVGDLHDGLLCSNRRATPRRPQAACISMT